MTGARVVSVEVEEIGTFTTSLSRLRLGYEGDRAGAPSTLVLKRSVAGRSDRLGESFATEIRFYRELAHRVPARVPRFYDGGFDDETRGGFLLMEDVAGIGRTDWRAGPSEEHAVPGFGAVGDALQGRIVASHAALAHEPTLLHGDAHAENMPLVPSVDDSEEVVFLDWAGPRRGNAGVDLGFFIPMSFPAERRPRVEEMLVAHHHDVLRDNGAKPTVDPWLGYRRGVLRRIARIIGSAHTWDLGEFTSLPWIFHRCATAAVELRIQELVD